MSGMYNSDGSQLTAPSGKRDGGVQHRGNVTAVDKLAVPAVGAASGVAPPGTSLDSATSYNYTVAASNRWGTTITAAIQAATPGGLNTALRFSISQVTAADTYDVFLSVGANPLWVTRVTEAQRAAGGVIQSVGGYTAGLGSIAGSLDVGVVGTGLASNVNPFAVNTAYRPTNATVIDCSGRTVARLLVKLVVTDLRSLPTLAIIPFTRNQQSTADWHQGVRQVVSLLTALGESLEQEFALTINGATGLVVLVDTITGQAAACSIWVELA